MKSTLTLFLSRSCCSKSCFSFCSCSRSMAPTSPFGIPSAGRSWYAGSRTALDLEVTYREGQQMESQDTSQAKPQVHGGGGRGEENGTGTRLIPKVWTAVL